MNRKPKINQNDTKKIKSKTKNKPKGYKKKMNASNILK